MRSICARGRSWIAGMPAVAEFILMPSTSTSTWSDSAPRRYRLLSLPRPPVLPTSMPARPRSRPIRSRAWLRSICARSITCAGTRLSASATSVRVPVTTTSSRSVADWASATMGRAAATAAEIREREQRFNIASAPSRAPRALHGVELRAERWRTGTRRRTARRDALRIATSGLQGRSPDSRVGAGVPRSPRLPMRMHSGGCGGRTRLPLRGQCRNDRVAQGDGGVTGFPFQPLDEDPRATLELAALYGMGAWRGAQAVADRARRRSNALCGRAERWMRRRVWRRVQLAQSRSGSSRKPNEAGALSS